MVLTRRYVMSLIERDKVKGTYIMDTGYGVDDCVCSVCRESIEYECSFCPHCGQRIAHKSKLEVARETEWLKKADECESGWLMKDE